MVAHHTTLIDRNHQLKLAERQGTIFNLKGQIEELKEQHQKEVAQISQDAANEIADLKLKQDEEIKGLNDKYEQAHAEASDISQTLDALRDKIKGWESAASVIDAKLDGEASIPLTFYFGFRHAFFLICTYVFCLSLFSCNCLCSLGAVREEQNARLAKGERIQTGPLQMEDYLTSFQSRIEPLLAQSDLLLDGAIHAHSVLHPGVDVSDDPRDVAEAVIATAAAQVELYCTSSARAGADDALSTVLSWYEGINVDKLKGLRAGSKWLTNDELVKKRKTLAIEIATYTDTDTLFVDPGEAAEAEDAGEDEEEQVDEEIDMEAAAARVGAASTDIGTGDAGTTTADAGATTADAGATGTEAPSARAPADIPSSSVTGDGSAAI